MTSPAACFSIGGPYSLKIGVRSVHEALGIYTHDVHRR